MKNIPLWQNIKTSKYPKLNENVETDILIVGGGITGISTFYQLKDDKRKVLLVEKNKIGYGATSRSSAKITFLQENIYSKLVDDFDIEVAKKYYESQKNAINILENICEKENIDCDLERVDSYLYTSKTNEVEKIKREKEILDSFGELTYTDKKLFNDINSSYSFYVKNTYVFHPLKFTIELAKRSIRDNHKIYENTTIVDVRKKDDLYFCYTREGNIIRCKYLIYAMHYPSFLFPYVFPIKCHIEKSYLLASKTKETKKISAINISNPILSFRFYKDYCLTIGESHNLCFKNNDNKNLNEFKIFLNKEKIDYVWSNHDIMTLDNLPYIGFIKDNLILATGFNTWGMTNGILAGAIIKDLLTKKENEFQNLFDPKRGISKDALINYPINLFSNSYSYIESKVNLNKSWYKNNPHFINKDGKQIAIYIDEKGKKHIVYSKCPHLRCSLIFNEVEKTWDCPCHGSRFDLDGKSIMGPSNYDISYKK